MKAMGGTADRNGSAGAHDATSAGVTELLREWGAGDEAALPALLPQVIAELRAIARRLMAGEADGITLQPTALVSELYLKLRACREVRWKSRGHFFAFAAQAMRLILVDAARTRRRDKRGGNAQRVPFDEATAGLSSSGVRGLDLIALDQGLTKLAAFDPELARLVELRFFAGLSIHQVAEAMSVSPATIYRYWAVARAWLYRELNGSPEEAAPEAP